ncbi:GNAT family N-acetyltransferase [Serratia sp. MMO-24]
MFFNCMLRDIKTGYLYLTRYDGESIKLADIFVFDNYRNIGVGSKLLEEAIKSASLLEIKFIYGVICGEEKTTRFLSVIWF